MRFRLTPQTAITHYTFPLAGIIAPGQTESQISKAVFDLAAVDFKTRQHWHVRLPRNGENTRFPIFVKRPDVVLGADDVCYLDIGPVFERVEADFGKTFVLGRLQSPFQLVGRG